MTGEMTSLGRFIPSHPLIGCGTRTISAAPMSKNTHPPSRAMDTLVSDVRFAVRSLVRSPSFSITAILALGLGIGSTAGVFSLLEGVVLRPLPYRQPSRLVTIWDTNRDKAL